MDQAEWTPARIMQLGLGFFASKTVLSAVELELFTILAAGPLSGAELRRRLELHERSARDFFDALVALGLLLRGEDGRYANTPEADLYLVRTKESYVGGLLEMANARLYPFWASLTKALRTGEPQNETRRGGDLFDTLYDDPERLESFLAAMTGLSLLNARAMAAKFPWAKYRTVIDIGTAQGCVPVQLARAHEHLTGGGFDLPPVRPVFERYAAANSVADRLRFHPGDFLVDEFPEADVLVMGHILHDWDLPTKKLLLAKAFEALPKGGALIVYELIIDDERRRHAPGLLMSLNMLIETRGGFDFTGADCIGWMREAGFAQAHVEPLAGDHSMVVGIK